MRFVIASASESGPRAVNEDSIGIWNFDQKACVAVADGLGGMGGGKRASQIAIEQLEKYLSTPRVFDSSALRLFALDVHRIIRGEQQLTAGLNEMATTLSAGVFENERMFVVHCGDSRVALARGPGIKRLTKDHSEAQRLFSAGKLTKEEYFDYPRKNILESALGIKGEPVIDAFEFELKVGDKIFFTSDGVHNLVLLRELRDFAEQSAEPSELIKQIISTIKLRGAEDNYSIVAVFVEEQS